MKKAVCALIKHPTNPNLFLGASRRNKPNEWGVLGGKCDPGETLEQAIIREVKEESGLDFSDPKAVFTTVCDGETPYEATTFVGNIKGDFSQQEDGILIKWCTKQELIDGPFGSYNRSLFRQLGLLDGGEGKFVQKDKYCSYCGYLQSSSVYPKQCPHCLSITYKNPRPVVAAIIPVLDEDEDKVKGFLFTQRNIQPDKGKFCYPGGFVEHHETWEEALIREVKEETSLTVCTPKLIDVKSSPTSKDILIFAVVDPIKQADIDFSFSNDESQRLALNPEETEIAWQTHIDVYRKCLFLYSLTFKDEER